MSLQSNLEALLSFKNLSNFEIISSEMSSFFKL